MQLLGPLLIGFIVILPPTLLAILASIFASRHKTQDADVETGLVHSSCAWHFNDSIESVSVHSEHVKQCCHDFAKEKGSTRTSVKMRLSGSNMGCELRVDLKTSIRFEIAELQKTLVERFPEALKENLK